MIYPATQHYHAEMRSYTEHAERAANDPNYALVY